MITAGADLDIIRRTRHLERFGIVNYENLLYPQYCDGDHFKTYDALIKENAEWLAEEAQKKLKESPNSHPNVVAHCEKLSKLCSNKTISPDSACHGKQ